MHFEASDLLARDSTVRALMRPLAPFLEDPQTTEVCVNRPGEVFVEAGASWVRHVVADLTPALCQSIATAVATFTEQEIGPMHPILSAVLPAGERIQIVLAPVVDPEMVSFTIRKPGSAIKTLNEYRDEGAFDHYSWASSPHLRDRRDELASIDEELIGYLEDRRLDRFLPQAVMARKNIAVVGETGSGKTTLMKTLCQAIPLDERLLTIEDVRELLLPHHPNRVHLLYAKGGQGVAQVSPSDLIASAMRMKPDRVLLAELRGAEAFDFLKLLTTGHAGSVTSFHAESCATAAERYVFMAKENPQAAIYDPQALKRLIALTIDVVMHVQARNVYDRQGNPLRKERFISAVSFDPIAKLQAQVGNSRVHRGVQP